MITYWNTRWETPAPNLSKKRKTSMYHSLFIFKQNRFPLTSRNILTKAIIPILPAGREGFLSHDPLGQGCSLLPSLGGKPLSTPTMSRLEKLKTIPSFVSNKFCILSLVIVQVQDNETLTAWQRVQQSRVQRAEQRIEGERRERDRRAEEFNQLRIGTKSLFACICIARKERQNHDTWFFSNWIP